MTSPLRIFFGFTGFATLFLSACAHKNEPEDTAPASASPASLAAPEAVLETPLTQDFGFADPNTTAQLITAEETKTLIGEAPKVGPTAEDPSNVVNVGPPALPEATLPEEPSN